jgi:hypothetical protein
MMTFNYLIFMKIPKLLIEDLIENLIRKFLKEFLITIIT